MKLTYYIGEVRGMTNYEKMYYSLFNAITDALRLMEAGNMRMRRFVLQLRNAKQRSAT